MSNFRLLSVTWRIQHAKKEFEYRKLFELYNSQFLRGLGRPDCLLQFCTQLLPVISIYERYLCVLALWLDSGQPSIFPKTN